MRSPLSSSSLSNIPPNSICLVVDALHLSYLGAYGNTWLGTPHWDRLASQALLFDTAFVDSPHLDGLYRACWQGAHAASGSLPAGALQPSLMAQLEAVGVETLLLTDEPAVLDHELAWGFSERLRIERQQAELAGEHLAAEVDETELARYFAQLISRIEQTSEPFFLWAHCGSLGKCWDAPLALRQALMQADEEETEGKLELASLLETRPPCRRLPQDFDPDEVLGLRRAYGAQVAVLDRCLGALDQALLESGFSNNTLLAVIGARGLPLGEHGQLGWYDFDLHEELIHIPWMLRWPTGEGAGARTSALVQPADLAMTLAAWHGLPVECEQRSPALGRDLLPLARGEAIEQRDRILLENDNGQLALRTPAWLLRLTATEDETAPTVAELYVKPDDRWEINEIGARCPAVAAELEVHLRDLADPGRLIDPKPLAPLSDDSLSGLG